MCKNVQKIEKIKNGVSDLWTPLGPGAKFWSNKKISLYYNIFATTFPANTIPSGGRKYFSKIRKISKEGQKGVIDPLQVTWWKNFFQLIAKNLRIPSSLQKVLDHYSTPYPSSLPPSLQYSNWNPISFTKIIFSNENTILAHSN